MTKATYSVTWNSQTRKVSNIFTHPYDPSVETIRHENGTFIEFFDSYEEAYTEMGRIERDGKDAIFSAYRKESAALRSMTEEWANACNAV